MGSGTYWRRMPCTWNGACAMEEHRRASLKAQGLRRAAMGGHDLIEDPLPPHLGPPDAERHTCKTCARSFVVVGDGIRGDAADAPCRAPWVETEWMIMAPDFPVAARCAAQLDLGLTAWDYREAQGETEAIAYRRYAGPRA